MIKKHAFAVLLSMACFTGSACAGSITIANFSFENPVVGVASPEDVVLDWNATGLIASIARGPVTVAEGAQYLQLGANGFSGHVDQTLGVDLLANTTYTLAYFVGARTDASPSDYTVALEANNVVLNSLSEPYTGPSGFMARKSFTFTTGSSVAAGQVLEIAIDATGSNTNLFGSPIAAFGAFDAITLDAATAASGVPEPSSLALSACGIALLGWLRKCRARA